MQQSPGICFNDDGYGSPQWVGVLSAETMLELRHEIRARRYRHDYGIEGCPGRCYAQSCDLLHVARTDAGYSAVCLITKHYDI